MSSPSICGNKDALIGYLYGECDAAERDAIEAHVLTCLTCATELRDLRGVRLALTDWVPPDAELGFRIVQDPPRARWFWPVPAWAQVAAAAVLFVAGVAAIANLEIRYGADGLVVRTGWARGGGRLLSGAGVLDPAAAKTGAVSHTDLDALASELRREFSAQVTRVAAASHDSKAPLLVPPRQAASEPDMRRVQAMIDRATERQEREFALRLAQMYRDVEANRRADLVRFEQSFAQTQRQTGAAIERQRDWMNYVIRTSQRQPQ